MAAVDPSAAPPKRSKASGEVWSVVWRCWPLLLGNLLEWYEFSLYGFLAPQLQEIFFRGSAMWTWIGFAVTFLSRPLGGMVLGWIADRAGRRVSVNVSILGMLVATVTQGLLPTFRSGSVALGILGLIVLMACRIVQGLSAGGEIGSITAYMFEVAPLRSLGVVTACIPITGHAAFFLSNGVVALLTSLLTEEQMFSWGWRLPFLLALFPGLVAVWGRKRFPESELFLEELRSRAAVTCELSVQEEPLESSRSPSSAPSAAPGAQKAGFKTHAGAAPCKGLSAARTFLSAHGLSLIVCTLSHAAAAVLSYVIGVWTVSYLQSQGMRRDTAMLTGVLAKAVGLALQPVFGWVIDICGIGWVMVVSSFVTMVAGLPLFSIVSADPTNELTVLLIIGVAFGVIHSLSMAFLFSAELYPTSVRSMGLGLGWNLGVGFFGGFGGVFAQATLQLSPVGPGYLVSASGAISLLAVMLGWYWQRRGALQLAHRRASPYWGPGELLAAGETVPATPSSADPKQFGQHGENPHLLTSMTRYIPENVVAKNVHKQAADGRGGGVDGGGGGDAADAASNGAVAPQATVLGWTRADCAGAVA